MTTPSVEERLARLEAIEEIKDLKYQYAAFCDAGYDPTGIASLFTEDAVWELEGTGRFVGPQQIADYFADVPLTNIFASHLMLNPLISLDGSRATGTWWLLMPCTLKHGDADPHGYMHLARYEDEFERVDGRWLFKHIKVIHSFFTPNGEDWAQETTTGRARPWR